MENNTQQQEYFSQMILKFQEQAMLNQVNLMWENHLQNIRNMISSGSELNRLSLLYNSIFQNPQINPVEQNQLNKQENKIFAENEINVEENKENLVSKSSSSSKKKKIRFFIEKDKTDDSEKFLEDKNYVILKLEQKDSQKVEKRFICKSENCGKEYKSKENLILHIKNKHHGEKPYFCKFCGKKYSHRSGKNFKLLLFFYKIYIGKTYHEINQHRIKKEN